jgi:DNA-binding beta-propeller fold protein YncE
MRPFTSKVLRTRRRRVVLGVALAMSALAGTVPIGGLLPTSTAETAPPITVPQIAIPDVPFPDLPASADLESLLEMLPAGFDVDDLDLAGLDLTQGDDIKKLLASLPINVIDTTFKLTDTPGSWFDSGLQLFGGKSLSVMELLPGVKNHVKFIVGPDTGTQTAHSATSLIRPVGAANIDQESGFIGEKEYEITEPGLYAFTCKIHPYMLGAIVADDPLTAGVDFGDQSIVKMYDGNTVVPTFSDIIFRLVKTFFTATVTSNWQKYLPNESVTWDPVYPTAPILTRKADGTPTLLPSLDAFFQSYFHEPTVLPPGNVKPALPGVGEVWIDTQFEETASKSKPGTATAIDVEKWQVAKKVALPQLDMNNPHNMWTDKDQTVIYQTEWFNNKLDVFDRESLELIRQVTVGQGPSHVMTRTDTDQLHVALNGGNAVIELSPYATKIDRTLLAQRDGEAIAHPHAHWMSSDGQRMVTPNPNSGDATLFDVPSGTIVQKPKLSDTPIASSMAPDDSKYYVANLLGNSVSCVSMDVNVPACGSPATVRKTIRLDANYDLVTGPKDGGPVGLLPIQIPVSPDGNYMLVANTSSGKIAVVDTRSDTLVKYLPCDPGCHGINFGAKKGGGYYGYVSNKFSNRMFAIDGDPNGDGNPADAAIVGSLVMNATGATRMDDVVSGLAGQGGQGVLAIPVVYNGWVQNLPADWKAKLTAQQLNPVG